MTLLIKHPLFRSLMVASCMLFVDTPVTLPKPNNADRTTDDETSPQGMKVTGTSPTRRRKSAKPKRSTAYYIRRSSTQVLQYIACEINPYSHI